MSLPSRKTTQKGIQKERPFRCPSKPPANVDEHILLPSLSSWARPCPGTGSKPTSSTFWGMLATPFWVLQRGSEVLTYSQMRKLCTYMGNVGRISRVASSADTFHLSLSFEQPLSLLNGTFSRKGRHVTSRYSEIENASVLTHKATGFSFQRLMGWMRQHFLREL